MNARSSPVSTLHNSGFTPWGASALVGARAAVTAGLAAGGVARCAAGGLTLGKTGIDPLIVIGVPLYVQRATDHRFGSLERRGVRLVHAFGDHEVRYFGDDVDIGVAHVPVRIGVGMTRLIHEMTGFGVLDDPGDTHATAVGIALQD